MFKIFDFIKNFCLETISEIGFGIIGIIVIGMIVALFNSGLNAKSKVICLCTRLFIALILIGIYYILFINCATMEGRFMVTALYTSGLAIYLFYRRYNAKIHQESNMFEIKPKTLISYLPIVLLLLITCISIIMILLTSNQIKTSMMLCFGLVLWTVIPMFRIYIKKKKGNDANEE